MKKPEFHFTVPKQKHIRLIIDTDAKNEADDQYAIVHALLTPKFDIKGIIAAHFGDEKSTTSMLDSYAEIKKLFGLMQLDVTGLIFHGAENKITDPAYLPESEGSQYIIDEALRNDDLPLYCIFLGPLTDMAIAVLREPRISERLTVIWIGGGAWPEGGWEYNLLNDIQAANIVFRSGVNLWQVPRNVYSRLHVSLAELQVKVYPEGKIGKYLFEQLIALNDAYAENKSWPQGESWSLGDSAAIGILLNDQEFYYNERFAPQVDSEMRYIHSKNSKKIRVYENIDSRFILEDFYAKLRILNRS